MARLRFVVTGGGTGGHIYPALAIAQGLGKAFPGCRVLYVGTSRGLEADIVPRAGISFKAISAAGLKRRLTIKNLWAAYLAFRGVAEALRLLRSFRPQVVIGTGGYVSGPVLLAAHLLRVPLLVHEQNAFPGLTNRLLARVAGRVMLTFPEAAGYLPRGAKVRLTGLPVRDEITRVDREQARLQLGEGAGTVILSFGGSRGAERLNKAVADVVKAFQGRPDVKIYHSTGTAGYDDFLRLLRSMGIDLPGQGNVTIAPYFYQIADYLAAADLVVCRAGAATIAELTYLGKPAILIPYPYAAANHQEFNAMALAKKGAANVIKDKELSGERLLREVNTLLAEPGRLRRMADKAARLANPDALEDIITSVRELVTHTRGRV